MIWILGLSLFIRMVPSSSDNTTLDKSDAIIVLTGAPYRIDQGIDRYSNNYAPIILISGVGAGATLDDLLREMPPKAQHYANSLSWREGIYLGHEATNTLENAIESRAWAKKHNIRKLHLITSNYHMPRSLQIFKKAFRDNAEHIEIIPNPVIGNPNDTRFWLLQPRSIRYILTEYHKWLYYNIQCYLDECAHV